MQKNRSSARGFYIRLRLWVLAFCFLLILTSSWTLGMLVYEYSIQNFTWIIHMFGVIILFSFSVIVWEQIFPLPEKDLVKYVNSFRKLKPVNRNSADWIFIIAMFIGGGLRIYYAGPLDLYLPYFVLSGLLVLTYNRAYAYQMALN